jgi:predicted nucleic acid-binding protein
MPEAISNTSPLLYLYRIKALHWLPKLFSDVWTPNAVMAELAEGRQRGYDVPDLNDYDWIRIIDPASLPSEWLTLDLGAGELAAMALALETPQRIVLLDDAIARKIAQAAGLSIWGTLKVMLETKAEGLTSAIAPLLSELQNAGMWISSDIRQRVLKLAGEVDP